MERWTYERRLLEFSARRARDDRPHLVVVADYVTTEDGTGLVHQSPPSAGRHGGSIQAYGLPGRRTREAGRPLWGQHALVQAAGFSSTRTPSLLLLQHMPCEHTYPHCWRWTCSDGRSSSGRPAVKDALLRETLKSQ